MHVYAQLPECVLVLVVHLFCVLALQSRRGRFLVISSALERVVMCGMGSPCWGCVVVSYCNCMS